MKQVEKTKHFKQVLLKTFLFSGVDSAAADRLFSSSGCSCAEFEPEERIYTRTSFQKSMGVVLSGRLKAVKMPPGGTSTVLNTFLCGDVFGVAGLFGNSDRYVSEIVAMRRSRVLFLQQQLLRDLFHSEPAAAENYIAFLSDRIRFLNTCIDHFTGGSAESRLQEFLLDLWGNGSSSRLELPCSLAQLSNRLGIGRASLYRAFASLTNAGMIRRRGRQIEMIAPLPKRSGGSLLR